MDYIKVMAYAKINLGLDVLRKREDGYHDLSMIMQTVNLYDELTLKKNNSSRITINSNLTHIPKGRKNIVYRAAHLFLSQINESAGINIDLLKRIPIAAGLAGGSADAAATFIGLNKLFQSNFSTEELMKMGVTLGADIPYCILKGTALSEGIGNILTPLDNMPECHIVLVNPNINVSTKFVYENLILDNIQIHPNIDMIKESIKENDLYTLSASMDNILETVTIDKYPIIDKIKKEMIGLGALNSLMSGSGPTVFGIFDNYLLASKAFHKFRSKPGTKTFLTKPYNPPRT